MRRNANIADLHPAGADALTVQQKSTATDLVAISAVGVGHPRRGVVAPTAQPVNMKNKRIFNA
jgi:hypothetical protein